MKKIMLSVLMIWTPLSWCDQDSIKMACMTNNIEAMQKLIDAGADINAFINGYDRGDYTPLMDVASKANLKMMQYLISAGADVHIRNKEGETALHYAAGCEHFNFKMLLMMVAGKNRVSNSYVIINEDSYSEDVIEVIQCLVNAGIDINIRNNKGMTPLHIASLFGNIEIVKYLISVGADINARDYKYNATPLHMAARMANVTVAQYLISVGADVNAQNNEGRTPYDLFKDYQSDIAFLFNSDFTKSIFGYIYFYKLLKNDIN
ncbi:MAG TPA: ankyrin repeat domain-containing protein [Candidatus Saccharimonadales bacterium]|nr:ankyrin repeat domain-containing protein [Candidatus Saccharimonadales bacterium]